MPPQRAALEVSRMTTAGLWRALEGEMSRAEMLSEVSMRYELGQTIRRAAQLARELKLRGDQYHLC